MTASITMIAAAVGELVISRFPTLLYLAFVPVAVGLVSAVVIARTAGSLARDADTTTSEE